MKSKPSLPAASKLAAPTAKKKMAAPAKKKAMPMKKMMK